MYDWHKVRTVLLGLDASNRAERDRFKRWRKRFKLVGNELLMNTPQGPAIVLERDEDIKKVLTKSHLKNHDSRDPVEAEVRRKYYFNAMRTEVASIVSESCFYS